jgi:hypothetical protein
LARFSRTLFASQTLKTLLKYQLTKQIFKCGLTINTFFQNKARNFSKRNKTLLANHYSINKTPEISQKITKHKLIYSGVDVPYYILLLFFKKQLPWWWLGLSGSRHGATR